MELVYSLAGAVIGGLIVLLIQQIYQNRRENKRSKSTHSSVNLKKLDKEVLNILKPGVNLALSIDILGNPTRVFSEDDNFINDEMVMTNSYLYVFKNALLKITSEDNITIDTITLLTSDKSFEIKYLLPEFKMNSNKLNMAVINKEISSSVEHKFIAARLTMHSLFIIQFQMHITLMSLSLVIAKGIGMNILRQRILILQ